MRLITAQGRALLIEGDGRINAPMSLYLNERFGNPHTREVAAAALRMFHRFLMAYRIDLASRALEGECLKVVECKWLGELAYRPLKEIDLIGDAMLKRLTVAGSGTSAMDLKDAVEPNTAAKRLNTVADFLKWYRESVLDESISSANLRGELSSRYALVCKNLDGRIGGTKQGHHHDIRSLPQDMYIRVLQELVLNPGQLFCNKAGNPSATMMRDRAIALLAAEGLRPGAIGNHTVDDFRYRVADQKGYIVVKDNVAKRGGPVTSAMPKAKGTRSTHQNYNSEITISLWPFTCRAIKDYIDGERTKVVSRRLANRSNSFLFLAEHGGPIGDRTTVSAVFNRIGKRLKTLGMLNAANGDPYARGKHYEFTGYTLRHSAATLFYKTHAHKPEVLNLMRQRFGWTATSTSPTRYANRAMSDAASVDMATFHDDLLSALAEGRQQQFSGGTK